MLTYCKTTFYKGVGKKFDYPLSHSGLRNKTNQPNISAQTMNATHTTAPSGQNKAGTKKLVFKRLHTQTKPGTSVAPKALFVRPIDQKDRPPRKITIKFRRSIKKPDPPTSPQPVETTSNKLLPGKAVSSSGGGSEGGKNNSIGEQRKLNKALLKALEKGQGANVRKYLLAGASLAYCNYDGLCTAAEEGRLAVFKVIFDEFDYTKLVDREQAKDLLGAAEEYGEETGKMALANYLRPFVEKCPEDIPDENCAGMMDGELVDGVNDNN